MAEEALLEAPIAETVPVDTGVDTPSSDVTEGQVSETEPDLAETEDQDGEQTEAQPETAIIDGSRLSAAAKAHLAQLKQTDPKLALQLRSALFEQSALKAQFPGGVKEVQALKADLQNYGGPEGIKSMREDMDYFTSIDQAFTQADPKFVSILADSNADSFVQLAPQVFDKFQELNPDGYSAFMGRVFAQDMAQNGVERALIGLQYLVGQENPQAAELLGHLSQYVDRIKGFSSKAVTPPRGQPVKQEVNPKDAELRQREEKITRDEWRSASHEGRKSIFEKEYAAILAGRKLDGNKDAAIREMYVDKLQSNLAKLPGFNQNLEKFLKAGDREGFLRYINTVYKAEIPKALRFVTNHFLPAKPGPKPPTNQNGQTKPGAAATPPAGFTPVTVKPPSDDFDLRLTTAEMVHNRRGILKDGRKISW